MPAGVGMLRVVGGACQEGCFFLLIFMLLIMWEMHSSRKVHHTPDLFLVEIRAASNSEVKSICDVVLWKPNLELHCKFPTYEGGPNNALSGTT